MSHAAMHGHGWHLAEPESHITNGNTPQHIYKHQLPTHMTGCHDIPVVSRLKSSKRSATEGRVFGRSYAEAYKI
eukprot:6205451-Pleurochrysis_carterae.AAC.4